MDYHPHSKDFVYSSRLSATVSCIAASLHTLRLILVKHKREISFPVHEITNNNTTHTEKEKKNCHNQIGDLANK